MQLLHSYPAGYPLFVTPGEGRPMPGIPWPVDVYYDPPYTAVKTAAINSDTQPQMLMCFHGSAHSHEATVALDTQASDCFIDAHFVQQHNIMTTPINRMVELADGSYTQIKAQAQVRLKLAGVKGAYTGSVPCFVVNLGGDYDVILGQDWLLKQKADLSYSQKQVTLNKQKVILRPMSKPPALRHLPLVSAMTMRRELAVGSKWFMVSVLDDKVAGFVPEPKPEADNPPLEIPPHVSPEVRQILQEYAPVFGKRQGLPPDRGITHVIPEVEGAKPVYKTPYRLSPLETAEVEKQIKELLKQGLIEPSNSPYGAPILFVGKKDGTLRMCCDWRRLNSQTVKSRYPLPRIDHLLDQLHGAKWFTTLDLQSGYHQILIKPEDVEKTAFTTPFGHYQWKVMSFGLCNAPATFQELMNRIFAPLMQKGVLVYLDDILIYAKSKEEHDKLLRQVLDILRKHDFYVKLSKCEFERPELKYLGHVVSADGIKVDPDKTKAVDQWPTPRNPKDIRAFLGLANYFRKFVPSFSMIAAPLTRLTRKDTAFEWTDACQQAFDGIKHALTHAPVLATPDPKKPFEVRCDASIVGVGAVLMQDDNPIAYESKKLDDAQVKWTTTEQELWAVVHALQVWRCYLEGTTFKVITDHNPLVHLQTQPNLSRKQARWVEYLQRFDFEWVYKPGHTNVADPLSRVPGSVVVKALRAIRVAMVQTRRKPPASAGRAAEAAGSSRPAKRGRTEATAPAPPAQPAQQGPTLVQTATATPDEDVDLTERMQEGYTADAWFKDPQNTTDLQFEDGVWWHDGRVVVPAFGNLRQLLIAELHDTPYSGHPGVFKTAKSVQRYYWWPGLWKDVQRYVLTCNSCQRNKASNQKQGGLLQPLPIPSQPWESVSMDFIVQLPLSEGKYDAILVFVDRLTKMVHIAPTTSDVDAPGTARLFVEYVFKHHGVPKSIVTDRGSVFTGTFMTEVFRLIGTKHCRSTAYHPQTDGQTERVNRVLEDMLRHFVDHLGHQSWSQCLAAAEFAINNAFHESIGTTPFRLNSGRDPALPLSIPKSKVPSAAEFAGRMEAGLAEAKKCLQAAQQRQKQYYDEGRRDVCFSEGEEVLLSARNIKLRRTGDQSSTQKFMPKWIGPFRVAQVMANGRACKLALPKEMRIHPVFHVSLLKPFRRDPDPERVQPPPAPVLLDGSPEYFVDRILDHRPKARRAEGKQSRQFHIRWRGYDPSHDSWEPEEEVENTEAYARYIKEHGLTPRVPDPDDDKV